MSVLQVRFMTVVWFFWEALQVQLVIQCLAPLILCSINNAGKKPFMRDDVTIKDIAFNVATDPVILRMHDSSR